MLFFCSYCFFFSQKCFFFVSPVVHSFHSLRSCSGMNFYHSLFSGSKNVCSLNLNVRFCCCCCCWCSCFIFVRKYIKTIMFALSQSHIKCAPKLENDSEYFLKKKNVRHKSVNWDDKIECHAWTYIWADET